MNADAVVVLVSYHVQPGKEEIARREIAALVDVVTTNEPACRGITMLQDASDPTHLLLHEHWSDQQAYLGPHMESEHIQTFIARAGEFLAGPPEITFWQPAFPRDDKR